PAREAAPKRLAARCTTPASAADPGRRPWSMWTAVTSQPAATASTRRASESAPPETAHVTGLPAAGNRVLGRRRGIDGEVTGPHQGEELGDRAGAELAADAAEAGVHVGAADLESGRGPAHRPALLQHLEQLAL